MGFNYYKLPGLPHNNVTCPCYLKNREAVKVRELGSMLAQGYIQVNKWPGGCHLSSIHKLETLENLMKNINDFLTILDY